jgi:hypothetical protein
MIGGLIKTLGVAGAALTAWYFLDPKKGAERRGNFVKSTKDLYDSASDEIGRIGKDIAGGVSDVVERVGQMTGISVEDGAVTAKLGSGDKAAS